MDPKTVEEIFKRLDTIGSKLLEGGMKFGEVMTRGAYAAAASDLFIGVVYTTVAAFSFKVASKGFQEKHDDRDKNFFAILTGGSGLIIGGMLGIAYLSSAIQIFIAPEWYAIKNLIGK
jgi:hypothetical protein